MKQFYFSKNIIDKLKLINNYSLTLFEAPAGYGKTTAVKEAMNEIDTKAVHWFTAVDFLQDASLEWFVFKLSSLDAKAKERLADIGFINRSNINIIIDVLMEINVVEDCYLIVDNFQIIKDNWPLLLIRAISDRHLDHLHVILISQDLGNIKIALENSSKCYFNSKDLLLNKSDIYEYAKQMDLVLNRTELDEIYNNTSGWAAAISLYLASLKENKEYILKYKDMNSLLYETFYAKITDIERELLLEVALFDCIKEEMLSKLALNREKELYHLLIRIPLIHYDENEHIAYPHEILRKFLLNCLDERSTQFKNSLYVKAAKIYEDAGNTSKAVKYYYLAKQDEAILNCELVALHNENFNGISYNNLALEVLNRTSYDLKKRYPISILRLCLALYAGADFANFDKYIDEAYEIIVELNDEQLLSEWYMVAAFKAFPAVLAMKEYYLKAKAYQKQTSLIFNYKEPFMFGTTSMWYLFYRDVGKMLKTAEDLKDMLEVYNSLTNNHGAGAYEMYMGEALSVQAKFDESDIYAHRAALLALEYQNVTITYGAALLLGINAIYQSDMISLKKAIDYLETKALAYPFLQHTALNTLMADTVRTYLLGLMMEPDRSAKWARGESDVLGDLTFTNFMAKTNRITDLILKKEYKKAIASVEASLNLDSRLISLSTRNFMCVGLALCYLAIGSVNKASEYLDKSLTMVEKDHNYTFIACFEKYFKILFILPSIKKKHSLAIKEIKALDIHYTRAEETHIFAVLEKNPNEMSALTSREQEVAHLVAEGLHNKEIAERLYISEETVKTHIKSIFNKMNIDRRSKLVDLLK